MPSKGRRGLWSPSLLLNTTGGNLPAWQILLRLALHEGCRPGCGDMGTLETSSVPLLATSLYAAAMHRRPPNLRATSPTSPHPLEAGHRPATQCRSAGIVALHRVAGPRE